MTESRSASTVSTSSTPPLAPSRWPNWLLVLETLSLPGMLAEDPFDGDRFGLIAQRRAGAVGVDVADVGQVELGVAQSPFHRPGGAGPAFVRMGDVAGIGAGAVAEHFGEDVRSASFGMLQFFEDEHAGPFAQHETVAIAIERPAGAGRIVVAFRKRPHVGETADSHGRDGGFGSTGDHHVGVVVLDGLEGVADGVGGAGTGGGHGIIGAAQAVLDRHLAAGGIDHQLGNGEGRNFVGPFVEQTLDLGFDLVQSADAATRGRRRSGTGLPS